jgi:DnaJ-class molecular chaperone
MTPSVPVFNPLPRGERMHGGAPCVLDRSQQLHIEAISHHRQEAIMADDRANQKGPNTKKKQKCKNCEGKGLLKKGEKVVKCQRCHGTGLR